MNKGQEILEAIDERGEIGILDLATKAQNAEAATDENLLAVRLGNGETVQTPNQSNLHEHNLAAIDARTNADGQIVVPLIAEEIVVGRKTVETGGVRVHKTVREDVQRIDEPIVREHLDVERVEINQFVETAPAVRYEGDVMIVPVLEEVVVTQKRLLLREEIRLTKRREEIVNVQEIALRREEISLEKIETENTEPETSAR